jgi:DHA2 family methylenomycin A resistance protein-like MFS transporter
VLGIVLTLRHATETTRSPGGVDVPGQAAAIAGLVALSAATVEGGHRGFADSLVLTAFALAALAALLFVLIESRSARPMLPLDLFRSRTFAAIAAIGLAVNLAFYGLIFGSSVAGDLVAGLRTDLAVATALALVTALLALAIPGQSRDPSRSAAHLGRRAGLSRERTTEPARRI